jgi:DNA-directed RNA polymerase alpha subunit
LNQSIAWRQLKHYAPVKGSPVLQKQRLPDLPYLRKGKEPATRFLALLSNPARNTLVHHGIDTIKKLAKHTEKEILALHGMGKGSLPALHKALKEEGLSFKKDTSNKKSANA